MGLAGECLPDPQARAWVEIDPLALAHNTQAICQHLGAQTELLAVIKADAYGHGAVAVAQVVLAHGATWLGVATLEEAMQLRRAGISAPILLLGGVNTAAQVQALLYWRVEPTLATWEQLRLFEQVAHTEGAILPVHLDVDTGMSRLGVPWREAILVVKALHNSPGLGLASIYSHLATADDPDPWLVHLQQQRFSQVLQEVQHLGIPCPKVHLANSAGMLLDKHLHYDMVRVGLALYGYSPAVHLEGILPLRPVLQVRARITQIKDIAPGTGVSYGHRFIAERPMRLATVGIGYADGVPRGLSNRMTGLVLGQRVAQVGTITMDQLMLDVTAVPQAQVGQVVTLIGCEGNHQITAQDWAQDLDTITWEILCGFKHRLPRVWCVSAAPAGGAHCL
ncbi:alanine racemase [Gloeomargarita lithophora Alchichica-D10]|uniref:Alanine racemase n=1 Tax=Gloeomargarita lithophora Alchichica-D10 TaxID=1188229 RepID=A0A1J0AC98_9CYAN|nr:alanine racemase [Gloeomargarita lithophora]APB33558.1 alanine racemase [Gloeomargarita lithophora Alchichica-D10]